MCAGAAETHPRQVERDRREPAAEAVRIAEARQPETGLQYRLLRDVLRLVRVREQAQRRRPCAAAMPRDERGECRPLAGTRGGHQIGIGRHFLFDVARKDQGVSAPAPQDVFCDWLYRYGSGSDAPTVLSHSARIQT